MCKPQASIMTSSFWYSELTFYQRHSKQSGRQNWAHSTTW